MSAFVEEFHGALYAELALQLGYQPRVFIDRQDLRVGDLLPDTFARALYQSVCLVPIITPSYFTSVFCLREFKAMELLEKIRSRFHIEDPGGLIIPVLLRGSHLPDFLLRRQYVDLSDFTTARRGFLNERIKTIADAIAERCRKFEKNPEAFSNVEDFEFPSEEDVAYMLQDDSAQPFPRIETETPPQREPESAPKPKAFISATTRDLPVYRRRAQDTLRELGFSTLMLEGYSTDEPDVFDWPSKRLAECDVFIGIYAWRYGWIPEKDNPERLSIIDMEFREAQRLGKRCLVFLLDDTAFWPEDLKDDDLTRIKEFRHQVLSNVNQVAFFTDEQDLVDRMLSGPVLVSPGVWSPDSKRPAPFNIRPAPFNTRKERQNVKRRTLPKDFPSVSGSQMALIMPALPIDKRELYVNMLNEAMAEFEINTRLRQAAFLATIAYESNDLRLMEEKWGPSAWQREYDPPGRNAVSLGNTQEGDGRLFRGRGAIQITGRRNYEEMGKQLGVDLLKQPDLAAQPEFAFRIAGLFWQTSGFNTLADKQDLRSITRHIGGGVKGESRITEDFERARALLGTGSTERPTTTIDQSDLHSATPRRQQKSKRAPTKARSARKGKSTRPKAAKAENVTRRVQTATKPPARKKATRGATRGKATLGAKRERSMRKPTTRKMVTRSTSRKKSGSRKR